METDATAVAGRFNKKPERGMVSWIRRRGEERGEKQRRQRDSAAEP
jgi:hypothetical protein